MDAQASFDDVSLTRIGGPVTVAVAMAAVRARGLEQGARIRGTGDEIVLEEFEGPIDVEAERAPCASRPQARSRAGQGHGHHGAIELEVPAGSRIDLQASAAPGEITADVPGLSATQTSAGKLAATLGGGGTAVVAQPRGHADVRLRGAAAVAQKTP